METIITIIILFAVFFFGKFIYDTYLTNNTERNFYKYRKIDQISSSKIERPKTQEQFTNIMEAVDNGLYIKPKNLSELFPEFVKVLTRMKTTTTTDSPTKLELECIVDEESIDVRIFMTIKQKLEDGQFYFHATFMDTDSEPVSSDKFLLGSRVTVVSNPPNWDKLFPDAFNNIDVKKTRSEFEKTISNDQKKLSLRFDGYYCCYTAIDSDSTLVLRFYPDGFVIYVKLVGDPHMINSWFKRDNEKVQKGNYTLNNYVFDFSVSSPQWGSSYFVGYLKDDEAIHLKVKGTHEVTFFFMQIDENKTYTPSRQEFPDEKDLYWP